jgi:hypothetical protein
MGRARDTPEVKAAKAEAKLVANAVAKAKALAVAEAKEAADAADY